MSNSLFKKLSLSFVITTSSLLLFACGAGDINNLLDENENVQNNSSPIVVDASGNYTGDIVIDLLEGSPKVSLQPGGRTNIVVQFIPRDINGFPLATDQIDIELKVDGDDIGSESYLQSTASELQFNVNFGLVLDTSYSMVDREAFTPMLNAASQSIKSGIDIWKSNAGDFNFYTSWFNDYIFYADNSNTEWTADDITSISAPASNKNASTKLFSAVDFMVNQLNNLPITDKSDDAPADQNIILVFSDGKDEYSWFDNSDIETIDDFTENGAAYTRVGYPSTDLTEDLIPNIKQSKNLTIHVIGLGDTIVEEDLKKIAQSGNGTFRKNPDSEDLKAVFDQVVQEFTTLQTHGASMTLAPDEYIFTLRVTNKTNNRFTDYSFSFNTKDENNIMITEQ